MKGSEKQIAWAEEIKERVISALNNEINKTNEESRTVTDKLAKALSEEDSAWRVINMFKDVRDGDAKRVSCDVIAQIRLNPLARDWAKNVLNYMG